MQTRYSEMRMSRGEQSLTVGVRSATRGSQSYHRRRHQTKPPRMTLGLPPCRAKPRRRSTILLETRHRQRGPLTSRNLPSQARRPRRHQCPSMSRLKNPRGYEPPRIALVTSRHRSEMFRAAQNHRGQAQGLGKHWSSSKTGR